MGKRFLCYDPDDVEAGKLNVDKDGVLRSGSPEAATAETVSDAASTDEVAE